MNRNRNLVARVMMAVVALSLGAACGSDDDPGFLDGAAAGPGADAAVMTTTDGSAGMADVASSGAQDAAPQPLYIAGGITFGASFADVSSYVALLPSLAANTQIDYTKVLALGGWLNQMLAIPGGSAFVVADGENSTLTRYEVEGDTFKKGMVLSFAGRGITKPLGGRAIIVSATKAYYFDAASVLGFVWNPSDMTITKELDISGLRNGAWPMNFEFSPNRRGDELVITAHYTDFTKVTQAMEVRALFVDTNTDQVTVATDTRCQGINNSVLAPNGDIYVSTDVWHASAHKAAPSAISTPCMLRIKAGKKAFDPSFRVVLADLAGGGVVGGIVPGPGNTGFLRKLDEALFSPAGKTPDEIYRAQAWRLHKLTLGDAPAASAVQPNIAWFGPQAYYGVEGAWFTSQGTPDFKASNIYRVTEQGFTDPAVSVRGAILRLARVR